MTTLGPLDFLDVANAARPYYPHHIEVPSHNFDDVQAIWMWCRDRFGKRGTVGARIGYKCDGYYLRTNKRWACIGRVFMFVDPSHAFEFKLRWG